MPAKFANQPAAQHREPFGQANSKMGARVMNPSTPSPDLTAQRRAEVRPLPTTILRRSLLLAALDRKYRRL